MEEQLYYMGRPIEELTKDELIIALKNLYKQLIQTMKTCQDILELDKR